MMKKFNILAIALVISISAIASFPVKKSDNTEPAKSETVAENDQALTANEDVAELAAQELSAQEKNAPLKSPAKPDKKVILLLLWFFLGGFAAHRWYAGKPAGWNILFILTAGGCGIWAIIDLIKIIKGDF